jgi:hypothetical protein
MPTFRARQQEISVLKSFHFGNNMYPLIEIVREHDRARKPGKQRPFRDIYLELIGEIQANRVFVDLPNYLKQTGSVQDEVLSFSLAVSNNLERRTEYLNLLSGNREKVIPVISSFLLMTGEIDSIQRQFAALSPNFDSVAFRIFPTSFIEDFPIVKSLARPVDYFIIDLDQISPFPKSPPLRPIVSELKAFTGCCKVLLRSAINNEIQNVKLDHGKVVFDADNSQIDAAIMDEFGVNATGDFVGIKKDDLTAGGTISPGFIFYNATENQFYGYRADVKDLSQFEQRIVPDVLASEAAQRMLKNPPHYLASGNLGYETLLRINSGEESGKSQAKFKRIAMEHYLYCMQVKIDTGELRQTNV